jgi:hypothetical protein
LSHKLQGPGVYYEVGLNIRRGTIVWINGLAPCGEYPDLRSARSNYFLNLRAGELTIADDGYRDRTFFIYPQAFPETAHWQQQIRARHETFN